jgi:large subunit ribosomal protein L23
VRIQDIIRRPLITEKSSAQLESARTVAFEVDTRASKIEIKRAVEEQFKKDGAKVAEVRIVNVRGKVRRQGRYSGKRPNWKKAYVRLAEGKIEFFEGM